MLINPFEIKMERTEVFHFSIHETVEKITTILVEGNAKLIASVEAGTVSRSSLEAEIIKIINQIKEAGFYDRKELITLTFNSIFGYGELEPYINDKEVSDILINSPTIGFIKKMGKKIPIPINFGDEKKLLNYCRKIVAICGGRLNENEAEVVVTDRKRNLRVVIAIDPVNVGSPSITIRKPTTNFSLNELVQKEMLTERIAEHLRSTVKNKETLIIAGKGGSGKTTLLGALINEMPQDERGLLIQETNEISVSHPDIISQLVKVSDQKGAKNYSLFDLTKFGLLMSIDRMFIGEMKDKEAYDFFNAIFTGHKGSMSTIHSNSAMETLDRLVLLMKRADNGLSGQYLMELLANSLNQVIFLENFKVKEITKILGFDEQTKRVKYNILFSSEGGDSYCY